MTNTDKLLMYMMEICRPDQVASMLEISRTKGKPISVMVIETVRIMLDSLPWEERREVVEEFLQEDGIDLEKILWRS